MEDSEEEDTDDDPSSFGCGLGFNEEKPDVEGDKIVVFECNRFPYNGGAGG